MLLPPPLGPMRSARPSIAVTGQPSRSGSDLQHSPRPQPGQARLSLGALLLFFASSQRLVVVSQKRSLALPNDLTPISAGWIDRDYADGFGHEHPLGETGILTGVNDSRGTEGMRAEVLNRLSLTGIPLRRGAIPRCLKRCPAESGEPAGRFAAEWRHIGQARMRFAAYAASGKASPALFSRRSVAAACWSRAPWGSGYDLPCLAADSSALKAADGNEATTGCVTDGHVFRR
jgi:hypothetical protein